MVLQNLGSMLEFLVSTPQVPVPNSPMEVKMFVDQSLSKYQALLDHVELEIVFAERYLQNLLDVRHYRLAQPVIKAEELNVNQEDDDDSAIVNCRSNLASDITYVSDWLDDGYPVVNPASASPPLEYSFSASDISGTGDDSLYNNHFNPINCQHSFEVRLNGLLNADYYRSFSC